MKLVTFILFLITVFPRIVSCQRNIMPAQHPFPYMREAATRYGVDAVQVTNPRGTTFDQVKFIEGLTADDYTALRIVYEQIAERADAPRISQWMRSENKADGLHDERRRAFLLFVLFKTLGDERGIDPFSDKRVRLAPVPEKPLDWSKLPKNLAWLAVPAEKYGIYQFPEEVDEFYTTKISPEDRAELRALAAKCKQHRDYIERFLSTHRMTEHREAELISFFRDLLDDERLWTD